MMPHRSIRGLIRYTSKKAERLDQERGREWFSYSHHVDGSCIFRAQCEIEEPEPKVLRDIVYGVGPDMVPEHLHVHVVPRWTGDSNFMAAISNTQNLPEALVDTAAKLRSGWSAVA